MRPLVLASDGSGALRRWVERVLRQRGARLAQGPYRVIRVQISTLDSLLSNPSFGSVAVLGAAGFVGRRLVSRLAARGWVIHAIDVRALDGEGPGGARVVYWTSDRFPDGLLEVATAVVLASQTNVDDALADPSSAFSLNLSIARSAAEWLRLRSPSTRLIYLSSDEVLGPSTTPLDETAQRRPTQPYAASKAAAEMIFECYRDVYGLDIRILRSCNLIGGDQFARKLIPTAVTHLMEGERAPVMGTGHEQREWMGLDDLLAAIDMAIVLDDFPNLCHVSTGWHATTREVLTTVADTLGVPLRTRAVEDRLVHDISYSMNSNRLRALGWNPDEDLEAIFVKAVRELAAATRVGRLRVADFAR